MKVFMSWSGERSQALANALRDWMPLVLHYVEPWLSEADVGAGERWAQAVAKELEASNFGIMCLTRENVGSAWVLFEAGALAKSMEGSRVIPLLLDLEFKDITGPLAQFQAKKVERSGLGEVIQSVNQAADQAVPEARVRQLFDALWPELEKQLASISENAPTAKQTRPQHEILEELVASVRSIDGRFRELESIVSGEPARLGRDRPRAQVDPGLLSKIVDMLSERPGDPIALLLTASMFRDEAPWLYELGVEAYRAARAGPPEDAQRTMRQFLHAAELILRGPWPLEEMFIDPRRAHMLLRALDQFLMREPTTQDDSMPKPRRRKEM